MSRRGEVAFAISETSFALPMVASVVHWGGVDATQRPLRRATASTVTASSPTAVIRASLGTSSATEASPSPFAVGAPEGEDLLPWLSTVGRLPTGICVLPGGVLFLRRGRR